MSTVKGSYFTTFINETNNIRQMAVFEKSLYFRFTVARVHWHISICYKRILINNQPVDIKFDVNWYESKLHHCHFHSNDNKMEFHQMWCDFNWSLCIEWDIIITQHPSYSPCSLIRASCLPNALTLVHVYSPKSFFCKFFMVKFNCHV